ncbi:MAG: acylneuraminate cytidylyltransferase family protein [Lachnospiraceae bacterium]|nr:acylneuraminate cytidylyltransferase family protein [Lachnospiraceae bacterium]
MKILFVITARGGSKGVPGKNIIQLGALPLIAYKIIPTMKCRYDYRLIVSTDDEKIAEVARSYGAEVPFMRPAHLATDTASSMDVIDHAMEWIEANDESEYDILCLLEPSSPFLSATDLNNALDLMIRTDSDTMLGMKEVEVSRHFIHTLDDNGGLSQFYHEIKEMSATRRQDIESEYTMNGCIYAAKWDYLKKNHLFHSEKSVPYIMPAEKSIEIDSMIDLEFARFIVANKLIDLSEWKSEG